MKEQTTEIFQYLHQHPELSGQETETTRYLTRALGEIPGVRTETFHGFYGLVATLQGARPGKTLVFRADIDALPIMEATDLAYASQTPGVMHACGHDVHMSVALATAKRLAERRGEWPGTVQILFQPEEESATGAKKVLGSHALDHADGILSLHVNPDMAAGTLGVKAGAITASVDRVKIVITGKGCHAAQPQNGCDPIVAASAVVQALQSIVSRNLHPRDKAVVSITHIDGGRDWNVIPDQVLLEGTVRAFDADCRAEIKSRMTALSENVAKAYDTQATVEISEGPPATRNDAEMAAYAMRYGVEHGFSVVDGMESMVGEDFAFYQECIPGLMIWLGVGKGAGLHNPRFAADATAIDTAAAYFSGLIMDWLEKTD